MHTYQDGDEEARKGQDHTAHPAGHAFLSTDHNLMNVTGQGNNLASIFYQFSKLFLN